MRECEKWLDKQIEEDKLPKDRPFDVEEGWKAALEWMLENLGHSIEHKEIADMIEQELQE